jgi:anti-sigma factor RsiW
MMDYEVLMMEALDGTISTTDRAKLEAYLDANTEQRAMFESMLSMESAMNTMLIARPPAYLTAKIMASARATNLAKPLNPKHIALIVSTNALLVALSWIVLAIGLVVLAYNFVPTDSVSVLSAFVRSIAQAAQVVLNVASKFSRTLFASPVGWVLLATLLGIMTMWMGVMARLYRPATKMIR